jgi:hypothetical protein
MSNTSQAIRYGVLGLLALSTLPSGVGAQGVIGVKTLQWEFRAMNIARVRGDYRLTAKAYSGGTHGANKGWRTDLPRKRGTWAVAGPLALQTSTITNNAEGHAVATGTSTVSALAAVVISPDGERPPRYRVSTTTTAGGLDTVTTPHPNAWQRARHKAKAIVKIRNAQVKGWALTGQINGVNVGTRGGKGRPNGTINEGGHSIHDPIIISVTELPTGETWSEEIFSLDILSQNGAGTPVHWEYDSSRGVMLSVERNNDGVMDGSVGMQGASNSDWLVESFGDFGATLANGVFEATGAWADLPWDLTMEGFDVARAELAPEYIPTVFDYVVPADLLVDDYLYSQSITWDDVSEGEAYQADVPSPGSVALLLMSGLVAVVRRRG